MESIAKRPQAEESESELESLWSVPSETISLDTPDVDVWRLSLDIGPTALQGLWPILSPDEQARAARFRFSTGRQRFTAARGLLRIILGLYLDEEPGKLKFCYATHGKPYLTGSELRFNLSHAQAFGLIAVATGREVGIDLEHTCSRIDHESIAEQFFSPAEVARLRTVPRSMRHDAFLACWTRKEAYVKAKGGGLSIPLDQFEVSLAQDEPARLLNVGWDEREADRWQIVDLAPGRGYVGALCVEGMALRLRRWQWPDDSWLSSQMRRPKDDASCNEVSK